MVSYQAVVDQSGSMKVKHYLVKNDDTHGAKKTLPDFLKEHKDLSCVLKLTTDRMTGKRTLTRCGKDMVLKEFYAKPAKSSTGSGYDDEIQVVL